MAVVVGAALLCACSAGGSGEETEDPGKKVAKGDCPDCDPAGPSAFEQAGLGLRFYAPGDTWKVAYQFKQRNDMDREALKVQQLPEDPTELGMIQEDARVELSEVFLFAYSVGKVEKVIIDNVQRDVALVKVEQAPFADSGLYSQQRLDTHEYSLEFTLDDLLRPRSETFYNAEYPHGRTIEVDSESSLSGLDQGSTLFPHTVPRILTQATASTAPVMTAELEKAADAVLPGWRAASYLKYTFENGDVVFWMNGQVWPFFVDGAQGYGLLVEQTLAPAGR